MTPHGTNEPAFQNYQAVQVNKQAESTMRLLAKSGISPKDPRTLQAHVLASREARDAAVSRFADIEKRFTRGWTGEGWKKMVKEILADDPNDVTGMLIDDYVLFSAYVHATALSTSLSISPETHSERERLATAVTFASVLSTVGSCESVLRFSMGNMPPLGDLLVRARKDLGLALA